MHKFPLPLRAPVFNFLALQFQKKNSSQKTTFRKNDLSHHLKTMPEYQKTRPLTYCTMPCTTPATSPAHKQCPQRPHKQRPPRSPCSIRAPLAGSFKLKSRKLVFAHFEPHMLPPPLDLSLPLTPPLTLQDINTIYAARIAFETLCLQIT
jgi:hypothetical protein